MTDTEATGARASMTSASLTGDIARALAERVRDGFERDTVPLLERLVNAPSHTHARDDVEGAFAILDAACKALGLVIERVPDAKGRFADHRVYRTRAALGDAPSLALVGHMDTVFPRAMGFMTFARDVVDGAPGDVVRGPGTLDMKSGLSSVVAALSAIRAVAEDGAGAPALDDIPLTFIVVSDEEVGSPSSEALYARLAPSLVAALVFEAGREGDRIVTARRGSGSFTITAHGKAAHAGNRHEEGVNAIHALALVVPRVEALTDYARGITLNTGLIEGGTAKNTVPDRARATIDMRFTHRADGDDAIAALRALVVDPFAGLDVPRRLTTATFTLDGGVARPPMEPLATTTTLRLMYEAHAARAGLATGEAPLQGGGSDANLLAAAGVPCLDGLGPYGKHFHQVEEWSSLASLERRTVALACFIVDGAWRSLERAT